MSETATQLEKECIPANGEKVRLLTLDHIDGRCLAVKHVRRFESQVEIDLGGNLSQSQKALARRASILACVLNDADARWASGEPLALADYLAASNCLRRLLLSLGQADLERRPRPVQGLPVLLGEPREY